MSIQDKLTTITENVPKVYEAGIAEGKVQGDVEFWKAFTNNGNRANYSYAFRYWGWKVANPSVKIKFGASYHTMMSECPNLETIVPDNFDFSATPDVQAASTNAYYHTFSANPKLKAIPDMNMPPRGMYYTFYNCPLLERIERVQIREDTEVQGAFSNLYSLTHIRFDGTIGTSINFRVSRILDRESIENIIGCLSDNVSGEVLTLSITAVNTAYADPNSSWGAAGSNSPEWAALVASKPNWTITLDNT